MTTRMFFPLTIILYVAAGCTDAEDITEQDPFEPVTDALDPVPSVEYGGGNCPGDSTQSAPYLPEEVCMECPDTPAKDPTEAVLPPDKQWSER